MTILSQCYDKIIMRNNYLYKAIRLVNNFNILNVKNKFLIALFSFLFVSGIVFILDDKLKLLNIINSSTLKNIESSLSIKKGTYLNSGSSVVLVISNTYFEKVFNSQTPLDKKHLMNLIQKISGKNPNSIIFDLDISPDYNFNNEIANIKNNAFYDYLMSISKDIKIVLPFAFISESKENKKLKSEWIRRMCKNNIHFAFPFISSEIGATLQYLNYKNHLSVFSNNLLQNKHDVENICNEVSSETILSFEDIKSKHSKKYESSELTPINFKNINFNTIELNSISDLDKYDLKDKVIFLGGSYGFGDTFITPYGEKYGVQIHDAIYYTLNHKIDPANIYIAVISDVLIGLLFGYIFSYILVKRANIKNNNGFIKVNIQLIAILVCFIYGSTILSTYLFHYLYVWLNPVPIVVGMFVDMLIGMGNNDSFTNDFKTSWLRIIIRILFIVLGAYSLIITII